MVGEDAGWSLESVSLVTATSPERLPLPLPRLKLCGNVPMDLSCVVVQFARKCKDHHIHNWPSPRWCPKMRHRYCNTAMVLHIRGAWRRILKSRAMSCLTVCLHLGVAAAQHVTGLQCRLSFVRWVGRTVPQQMRVTSVQASIHNTQPWSIGRGILPGPSMETRN